MGIYKRSVISQWNVVERSGTLWIAKGDAVFLLAVDRREEFDEEGGIRWCYVSSIRRKSRAFEYIFFNDVLIINRPVFRFSIYYLSDSWKYRSLHRSYYLFTYITNSYDYRIESFKA